MINLKKLLIVSLAVLFLLNTTRVQAQTNEETVDTLDIVKVMEFDVNAVSDEAVVEEIVY